MLQALLDHLVEVAIVAAVTAITGTLLPKISTWFSSKTKSEALKTVIEDLTQTAITSMEFVEQTMVRQYKSDGRWNTDSQAEVLNTAVEDFIDNLTANSLKYIDKNGLDVVGLATRYIQAEISKKKKQPEA